MSNPRDLTAMLANAKSRVERDEDGYLYVDLNDFFAPAADMEVIPPECQDEVLERWNTRGWWGILDWVIQRRYVAARGVRVAPQDVPERVAISGGKHPAVGAQSVGPSPAAVEAATAVAATLWPTSASMETIVLATIEAAYRVDGMAPRGGM